MYALIPSFTSRALAAFRGTPSGNSARRTSSDVYRRRTSVRVVFIAERLSDSRGALLVALPGNSAFRGAVNTSTIFRRSRALASLDLYGYSHRAEAAQAETTDLDGQHQEGAKAGEIGAQVVTRKRRKTVSYERGSANVYSDLGYRGAGDMLVKAKLVSRIAELLAEPRLTQTRAARLLGVPQPKLSKLLRGQFRGVSERKLMDCLTRLGQDITIVVRTTPEAKRGAVSVSFA